MVLRYIIDKINHREEDDLLNKVLNNCSNKIIIEAPVEYILSKSTSKNSFEEAVKKTMRLAPETIMIGEDRDNGQNPSVITSVDQSYTIKSLLERFKID